MRCSVTAQGRLTGCTIIAEDPKGYGFGDAALGAAGQFKLRPQTSDGTPVDGGTWTTRLTFKLGDE
jgi:protein TonB